MLITALSLLLIVSKDDSSIERIKRFNTVCADAVKNLLGNRPQGRAGLILNWIRANANKNSLIRLWYFDRKEKRWRRHLFSSRALNQIIMVPDPNPEIILRDQGESYRLEDFYFRNEIKLSDEEERAHLKDVSESIRRSYQYPRDAKASPFEATGTERMLARFLELDPLLVSELIAGDPDRANRVIREMVSAAKTYFSDQASQSIARQFGIRGTEEQIGIEARARKKFEELFAATADDRLNPTKIFNEKSRSHMTMMGAPALTELAEKANPIYRYRGTTGNHSLPRNPETLDSLIRARLSGPRDSISGREKFEWALVRDERTADELKKLSQRDRRIFELTVAWIASEIPKVAVNDEGLPSQEFVARLQSLSENLNEPKFDPRNVFASLYGDGRVVDLPREQGSESGDKVLARFKRRLLRIGNDREISVEEYRREILDGRTEFQLRALKATLDGRSYDEAIEFLLRHIQDRNLLNSELRTHLRWLAKQINEPRLDSN